MSSSVHRAVHCGAFLAATHNAASGRIVLLLDCDGPGETGARDALWLLAQYCDVRLGWSSTQFDGQFHDRQPESLTKNEWELIASTLTR